MEELATNYGKKNVKIRLHFKTSHREGISIPARTTATVPKRASVSMVKNYPEHWGEPPLAETRDLRPLPGSYGMGSKTLALWIHGKMKEDEDSGDFNSASPPPGPPLENLMLRTPTADMRWIMASMLQKDGHEAVEIIKKKMTKVDEVVIVNQNDMVTQDYKSNRIRVFVDEEGRVSKVPKIG